MYSNLLKINIGTETVQKILYKIDKFLSRENNNFFHVVNLNPDIFVLTYKDERYRQIINKADLQLIDGIGIKIASRFFGKTSGERMTGTDLMTLLVKYASENNKKVMFLGGKGEAAKLTGINFKKQYSNLNYNFDSGSTNIKISSKKENNRILNHIRNFKPDLLFVAYGSPYQEKWIYQNKKYFKGVVCMGVGGAFNFISGKIKRAPKIFTRFGFEWLWRLIFEPARIKKLPRHLYFLILIIFLSSRNIKLKTK